MFNNIEISFAKIDGKSENIIYAIQKTSENSGKVIGSYNLETDTFIIKDASHSPLVGPQMRNAFQTAIKELKK